MSTLKVPGSTKTPDRSTFEDIKSFDYSTFEKIVRIGKGGFGSVKLVYAKCLGKYVAIKSLYDIGLEENFKREVIK